MTNFEKVGLFMKTYGQEVKTNAGFSSVLRADIGLCKLRSSIEWE